MKIISLFPRIFCSFLFVVLALPSTHVFSESSGNLCQDNAEPININVGDVVSAELLSEIVGRLNDSQKGMVTTDLLGTWTCTSNIRPGMSCSGDYTVGGITKSGPFNGYSLSGGRYTVTQDVAVTSVNDDEVLLKYPSNMGQCFAPTGVQQQCVAQIIDGSRIFNRALTGLETGYGTDCSVDFSSSDCCFNTGSYEINRRGKYCFTMENINETSISCVKKDRPPLAPSSLAKALSSSEIGLSWTAPTGATSYEVHRKGSASATFLKIGTSTSASYSDTAVDSGMTYWYRVFAKNANGTSTGSNVIKVTFNPSASLSSTSIGITDYLNGLASAESEHKIIYSTASNTMTANLSVGKLDAENLNGLLAGTGGKSPVLKFTLANVPSAGMSGTATLATKVLDGANATVDTGERAISASANVSWSSDGSNLTLTVPRQTQSVTLVDSSGAAISGNWDIGGSSDLVTISSSGINQPSTLDVKLLDFLASNISGGGPALGSFFTSGDYFYEFSISGIGLADAAGKAFTKVQGSFGVDSNPGSVIYVDDVSVSESLDMATVLVTLSSKAVDAVTLDYATTGSTATSGTDFTASSGSIRIAAGTRQGAFTVPLTNDSTSEGNETFTVALSNVTNAVFGRSAASVTIVDNDSAS